MVSPEAWEELDGQAKRVFGTALSARKVVDFVGPKGWGYGAHTLGRLKVSSQQGGGVSYGIHSVLPLVEARQEFALDIWELDNIARSCKNPDLKPLEDAARAIAAFEEKVVYGGFEPAGVEGLAKAGAANTVSLKCSSDQDILKALGAGGCPVALERDCPARRILSPFQKG
jgi:uncharacterized linocin/CFP29 family protein